MNTTTLTNFKIKKLDIALRAYRVISDLSESELETIEILSNQKNKDLILKSIRESKDNKIYPIESIL